MADMPVSALKSKKSGINSVLKVRTIHWICSAMRVVAI